jgi:hypothetical protein
VFDVEVNQVVENLHVRHLDACLRLDKLADALNVGIDWYGDSFVFTVHLRFSPHKTQPTIRPNAMPKASVNRI